jgi:hypothetical protein
MEVLTIARRRSRVINGMTAEQAMTGGGRTHCFGGGLVTSAMMCSRTQIVRPIRNSERSTAKTSKTVNHGTGALSRSNNKQVKAAIVPNASAQIVALKVFQSIGYSALSRTTARRSEVEKPSTIDVAVSGLLRCPRCSHI